jgi:L-ascorbate metabolism protein UlaG (beta-lactamase superfamily)
LKIVGGLVAAALVLGVFAGWWLSSPPHRGPVTDHFDGSVFHNREQTPLPSADRAIRLLTEPRATWPVWRENTPQPPPPERVADGGLRATFINHATVLVQMDGVNVLTDPIWSERCAPVQFAGPKRHHAPGIALEDLPPIDVVLISHNHYDHLDVPTLRRLQDLHDPLILAGLGNEAYLRSEGFDNVEEMDWGDALEVGPLTIHGQRSRHFSSRGLFDRQKTLWIAFVVEGAAGRVYFGGDTGYGSHFADTGEQIGPFRLALLPIGAYGPRWFMGPIHMDPQQAVQAHADLRAQTSIGVHHGTFQLTSEGMDDPAEELADARRAAGLPARAFRVLTAGEGAAIPR